jgi:hypothetical protein
MTHPTRTQRKPRAGCSLCVPPGCADWAGKECVSARSGSRRGASLTAKAAQTDKRGADASPPDLTTELIYEPRGRGFESCRARHSRIKEGTFAVPSFFPATASTSVKGCRIPARRGERHSGRVCSKGRCSTSPRGGNRGVRHRRCRELGSMENRASKRAVRDRSRTSARACRREAAAAE